MTGSYAGDVDGHNENRQLAMRRRETELKKFLNVHQWATIRVACKGPRECRLMPTLLGAYEYSQFISWCKCQDYITETGNPHWPFMFKWDESPLSDDV